MPVTVVRPTADGAVLIDVLAVPRASRTRVVGVHDGRLRVQLAAPPVDGAANEALLRLLATTLDRPQRDLEVVQGATGRRKTVRVEAADVAEVAAAFGLAVDAPR